MNERAERLFRQYMAEEMTEEAKSVRDLFASCFGEDHIDMVKPKEGFESIFPDDSQEDEAILRAVYDGWGYWNIIVKFDHEVVTNEVGMHVDIYDLFVRIPISKNGMFRAFLAYKRSTFTENQLFSGYIHSHTPRLNLSEGGIKRWGTVCTGSGPIGTTINTIRTTNDQNLWLGFIAELRQIVRRESLEGGPYIRMEYIKGHSLEVKTVDSVRMENIRRFVPLMKSYIRAGRMRFGFVGGEFCLGIPVTEWLVDFTNYAIAWGRENLESIPTTEVTIQDNKIFIESGENIRVMQSMNNLIGKPVITFKGRTYPLTVLKSNDKTKKSLFDYRIALTLLKSTLGIINYWHGKSEGYQNTPAPVFK